MTFTPETQRLIPGAQTPEWVGMTVTGPSPVEDCFLMGGGFVRGLAGELAQVPHLPK